MARIFGYSYRRKSTKALSIDSLWLVFFIVIVVCKNFENAAFSPGAALPREIAYTFKRKKEKKHTTAGIRWRSPTQLLISRSQAYVWQSGRDTQLP